MSECRIAVFASGRGSNLRALYSHLSATPGTPGRVALVVADRAGIGALHFAAEHAIPGSVLTNWSDGDEILTLLNEARIDAIVLAGYNRLIPLRVIREYHNRILNIHPSLLPSFGGKGMYGSRVHRAVLAAGATVTGVTVHLVDEEYDRGRILAQWPVPVLASDSPESLAARVLQVEHRVYPAAVAAFVDSFISWRSGAGTVHGGNFNPTITLAATAGSPEWEPSFHLRLEPLSPIQYEGQAQDSPESALGGEGTNTGTK